MKTIKSNTYSIVFQKKGYQKLAKLLKKKKYSSLFILVDENTIKHCYPQFISHLKTTTPIQVIKIQSGEIHKNIQTCMSVWNKMSELNADRYSLLISLGGGVITDLGSFVASTYKRGIDFINIPTTLLSMVDASIGGKTGVDLGVLKNQIGVFANPKIIVIDTNYLKTLSGRETRSAIAEIIKYGLIFDINLYNKIKNFSNETILPLIYHSIKIKNFVVLKDFKEKNLRKTLNFGHTIGHAIESYFLEHATKKNLTHGEAIGIGMICESFISFELLGFSKEFLIDITDTILTIYGKFDLETEDFLQIICLLKHDKKNSNGQLNFTLLNNIEDFKLNCKVHKDLIIKSLNYYNSHNYVKRKM